MSNSVNSMGKPYNQADRMVNKTIKYSNSDKVKRKTENIDLKVKQTPFGETDATAMKSTEDGEARKIKEALEQANQKARFHKTACEFSYDDTTNRISITIRDKETDEIIRQVPAEETLEMISKLWEQAGILIDEKR